MRRDCGRDGRIRRGESSAEGGRRQAAGWALLARRRPRYRGTGEGSGEGDGTDSVPEILGTF